MRFFSHSLAVFTFLALGACASAGTTAVGNAGGSTQSTLMAISIGAIDDDGDADVSIPLEIFGDSTDDVDDATVDVDRNGERYVRGLDASSYYNQVAAAVRFTMTDLSDGDVITITINLETGDDTVFLGTVSTAAAAEALSGTITEIITTLCSALTTCFDTAAYDTCTEELFDTEQLDDELFTAAAEIPENSVSLEEIQSGLDDGTYTADATVLEACVDELSAKTCEELTSGFSESSPSDFENIENVFGSSCDDLLDVVETTEDS